jgi:hypothetical protein
MTPAEQKAFQEMRELHVEGDSDDWIMLDDILDGSVPLDMSHEGGEFDGFGEEFRKSYVHLLYVHMPVAHPKLEMSIVLTIVPAATAPKSEMNRSTSRCLPLLTPTWIGRSNTQTGTIPFLTLRPHLTMVHGQCRWLIYLVSACHSLYVC